VESLLVVLALFVLAGGGIVIIDTLIIKRIRRLGLPSKPRSEDSTTVSRD
jgi:hypothetical protein